MNFKQNASFIVYYNKNGLNFLFRELESESASLVPKDRFLLIETTFNIRTSTWYIGRYISISKCLQGISQKFTFTVEISFIRTTFFNCTYQGFIWKYSVHLSSYCICNSTSSEIQLYSSMYNCKAYRKWKMPILEGALCIFMMHENKFRM